MAERVTIEELRKLNPKAFEAAEKYLPDSYHSVVFILMQALFLSGVTYGLGQAQGVVDSIFPKQEKTDEKPA